MKKYYLINIDGDYFLEVEETLSNGKYAVHYIETVIITDKTQSEEFIELLNEQAREINRLEGDLRLTSDKFYRRFKLVDDKICDNFDKTSFDINKAVEVLNGYEKQCGIYEHENYGMKGEYHYLKEENEELKEELSTTRKNREKLIKKYNNKIKKLKREKHLILSTINRFVNKYEEKSESLRFNKPNTPDDYINQGRLRMLGDLMNVLESHGVQEK